MKASEARELSKKAVCIEIADFDRKIFDATKEGRTHINFDKASEGATAHFIDEGYNLEAIEINAGRIVITKISW